MRTILFITALVFLSSCGGGGGGTTQEPTEVPTEAPTQVATQTPTATPTATPTEVPTDTPTLIPTETPTQTPTEIPTETPTQAPTQTPVEDGLAASDEPYYNYSWHIDSANSVAYLSDYSINQDADIGITQAWEISKGEGVKVAVIDDGFDVEHEDLKDNIAIVYNADNGSSDVSTSSQEGSHGNSCAGFIVAPINGKGSMGTAPQAKLIGIKLLSEEDSDTIKAFEYAQNQGAKVISCSWGTNDVSQVVVAKLQELYDAGITVLFASGNEGASLDVAGTNDESEVEWVIGVGASGENNDVTSYSNYGANLDIIAPAGDTYTLGVLGIDNMGSVGSSNQLGLVSNNYAFMDGTSFATPITAGVVALMYAVNPNITPAQVKSILTSTATKVGGSSANYIDGFDQKRAYGKVNAYQAVIEAQNLQ